MNESLTWLGIAICIVQSAIFSGLNLAVFSLSRLRLEAAADTGEPPLLVAPPSACPFRNRCTHAHDRCARENPARRLIETGHDVACHWDHRSAGAASEQGVPA